MNSPTDQALPAPSRPPATLTPACEERGRANQGADLAGSPPRRGPSLARRLALMTTLVVTGTMATISGAQLWFDLRADLRAHETRLRESLAPLVSNLRTARTSDEVHEALASFHGAYLDQGYVDHRLSVVDDTGKTVVSTATPAEAAPHGILTVAVPLMSPAFGTDPHRLVVAQDSSSIVAARDRRSRGWLVHVSVTALLTLALLSYVLRREVTQPIDRLLESVRRMELGYWDDVRDPGGAWEIRWLGWRFRVLGLELKSTVENLVAAQRRAFQASPEEPLPDDVMADDGKGGDGHVVLNAGAVLVRMQGRLARLGRANSASASDQVLARLVWDREAPLAEQLGQPDLAAALEDAALKILEPAGFADVCAAIARLRPRLDDFVQARKSEIICAAAERGVRLIDVQWRIKHAAGVWRKMQLKGLRLEQIHDLVALRLIVPGEADCYRALGVVHDLYRPVVGRFKDYIASPKPNGYRSVHCSVQDGDGWLFEVQIRTSAMHQHAERGSSSHATYRDATRSPQALRMSPRWRRGGSVVRNWWRGDSGGS